MPSRFELLNGAGSSLRPDVSCTCTSVSRYFQRVVLRRGSGFGLSDCHWHVIPPRGMPFLNSATVNLPITIQPKFYASF